MSGHSVAPTSAWTSGLCGCCSDCKSCWLVFCCPCVALGQVAETLDKGVTSCGLAGCIYAVLMLPGAYHLPLLRNLYSCTYRRKLRAWYGLPEEPCTDCCVHFWCEPCALCQMYRELKNRGADPADGSVRKIYSCSSGHPNRKYSWYTVVGIFAAAKKLKRIGSYIRKPNSYM